MLFRSVVTHEMNFAKNVSDKVIFMEDGQVLDSGTAQQFFENQKEERIKQFLRTIQESKNI